MRKGSLFLLVFFVLGNFLIFAGDGMSFFWGGDDDEKKKAEELKQEVKKEVMKDVYIQLFKDYVKELEEIKRKEEREMKGKEERVKKEREKQNTLRGGEDARKVFEEKVVKEKVIEEREVVLGEALRGCSYNVVERVLNPENLKELRNILEKRVKEGSCDVLKDFFINQVLDRFIVDVEEKNFYVKDLYMREYYIGKENFERFKRDVMGLLVDGKAEVRFREDGYVEVVDVKKGHERVMAYLDQVWGIPSDLERFHFDIVMKKGDRRYHYNGSFFSGQVANLGIEGSVGLVRVMNSGGKKAGWEFRLYHVMGINRSLTFLEGDFGKKYMFVDGDVEVEIMINRDMAGRQEKGGV